MHGLLRLTGYTFFLLATPAIAAEVFRCEDNSGHITFTLQGCPIDQSLAVQNANNPTPGSGRPVAMAKPATSTLSQPTQNDVTVVAEKQDGCGNRIVGSNRRTAIIRKQIQAGMTQNDVESALGEPAKQSSRNGETTYTYNDNQGSTRQINFDQHGCVKAKH